MFTDKVVLVTGGAGFIGSHLVEKCLELNAKKVISFDNLCGSTNDNLAHLRTNPRLVEVKGDIQDYYLIKPYVEEANVIFNQAASKLVVSLKDPSIDVKTNVLGNFNILEIMRKCNSQARLIHASTGSVFGSSEKPFDEDDPMKPSTVYGISKLAAEKYILLYAKEYGLKASVLRYYHVFGPRQDYAGEAGVINIFLSRIWEGKAPQVCGTGEQVRCFTYVKDVVAANLLLYQN
ncbi:MAG: NAD-dependent epimerase/dehydratase family protein, partial [Nanoarchaeota archaeon]|nr:NAD-dependent epimerase/dehydratase family protein [Nanoarchaeota archaeon]